MHTNRNRCPVGIASEGRLLWLAPLILALFGCGGGGSADATAADEGTATATHRHSPRRFPSRSPDSGRRS